MTLYPRIIPALPLSVSPTITLFLSSYMLARTVFIFGLREGQFSRYVNKECHLFTTVHSTLAPESRSESRKSGKGQLAPALELARLRLG